MLVEIVVVEEQAGLQLVGEKEAVVPEGRPEAEKETDWLGPEIRPAVTVVEIELPWTTETETGLIERLKSKAPTIFKVTVVVLVSSLLLASMIRVYDPAGAPEVLTEKIEVIFPLGGGVI